MRFIYPVEVNGKIMMITASIGLIFNLIMGKLLHSHGHDHGHRHSHNHDHNHEHKEGHDDENNNNEKKHQNPKSKYKSANVSPVIPTLTDNLLLLNPKSEISVEVDSVIQPFDIEDALKDNEKDIKKMMVNVNIRAASIHILGDII